MGFSSRRPILPAPTESLVDGSADEASPSIDLDIGTDLSRRSEKTSQTIPDDGSPITITTASKHKSGKLTKTSHQSQTSLLIEYFEEGKKSESGQRRPSLRVRYTPSRSRKNNEKGEGHILVTEESPTARRPSISHHISLGGNDTLAPNVIDGSISSLETASDLRPRVPVEIEVLHHHDSDRSILSPPLETRSAIPESEISSMPAESSLGPNMAPSSVSIGRGMAAEGSSLKPPIIPTERNLSNERITQKVIEKLSNKPRVSSSGKRHHSSHSGSRSSVSREVETTNTEPRIRVTKTVDDDSIPSATGSSLISGSHLSADPRGADQRSVRSGGSNISITNNPKLLQTVEDAIRRLILPELNELRRDQKHSRSRSEKHSHPSDISSSSVSREERTRRKSSGSKSKRRSSREADTSLPSEPRTHRRRRTADYDSTSEQSYEPSESHDSIRDEKRSHKHKSHRSRDVAAGALGGAALTAAALKSHDSGSSLEYSEHRRRRRSKSRSSRTMNAIEKEDVFEKHHVPPMPFVSETGTDLTRSSLKSSNDGRAETPTRREVREVVRGSPLELSSPTSQTTPTGSGADLKRGLGTHHGNFSEHDLSAHDVSSRRDTLEEGTLGKSRHSDELDFATHGFAALTDPERARQYEGNLHQQHPIRRGLSPIQSVASYATTEPNRNSMMQPRSSESLHSPGKQHRLPDQMSVSSHSSAPSVDLTRTKRPHGMSLESRSEVMVPHAGSLDSTPRQIDPEAVFDEQHLENEIYRDSPYIDKVTAGQHVVAKGLGATAGYVDSPMGVESAVASLIDASVVSVNQTYSPRHSHADSIGARDLTSPQLSAHEFLTRRSGSPLKQQFSHHSIGSHRDALGAIPMMSSPLQSPARSLERFEQPTMRSVQPAPLATNNVPSGPVERSPESDITTNPSIIRGPIGGLAQGNTEHWPYDATPPHSRQTLVLPPVSRDIGSAGADLIPEPLSTNRDYDLDSKRDLHSQQQPLSTSLGAGDEGYETGANVPSPGLYSQGRGIREDTFTPEAQLDNDSLAEDPFTTPRGQYVDGLSHGLSPLYSTASGQGRDNIQSRDIVALMDHLTMRDAQRNARDTEILVTLVRSAAEMRNSFEDMRKFINEQGDNMMDTADRQHEKTQRLIGGPRPQPVSRATISATSEDDAPSKRRNVFQRALRGLGAKNTTELQNIETMLMRLLDEVEALRATQPAGAVREPPRSTSLTSADNGRAATDTGYEPEGQAGTSSTGDRSGFFSNNSSRQADYRNYSTHRDSGNRVSTVMEGDEEYDEYENDLGQATPGNVQQDVVSHTPLATPPKNLGAIQTRGNLAPLQTPPRTHESVVATQSNENTPHLSAGDGSGRKHKSFASSFFPKMVSRWSKTTASSENYRASQQRVRPYSEHSQSGSNLGEYDFEHDPQGDDRLRSNTSFQQEQYEDENRPPSPLVPSQVSDNPKYQAHRNSLNLQHPQPRQGPSGRFQSRLETEAQNYDGEQISPTSQTSSQWEAHSGLHPPATTTAYGGHLSPISDAYSAEQGLHQDARSSRSGSSNGPPRPPKIPNDGPLVPQRPPKVVMSPPLSSRQQTYVDHVAVARAGSPALDKSPVAALRSPQSQGRKPSGPRPPPGATGAKGDLVKRTRFRGSPNQIDSDDEAVSAY